MTEKKDGMDNSNLVGLIKDAPQVLSMVYQDLAQPGVKKVGQALETVFEFSTCFLLPVKLLNEKFKINFEKRLDEYKKKIESIPDEKICDVNPQIGTPLIEKLSYTTNDEIADLFTTLLAKASSVDTVNEAHPSFIQMIEKMSIDEARIIKYLKNKDFIPTVTFDAYVKGNTGFLTTHRNLTLLPQNINLLFPNNILSYLDNLTCMGVLEYKEGYYKTDDNIYKPIRDAYNYDTLKNLYNNDRFEKLDTTNCYYEVTYFGKLFISSCIIV